MVKSFTFFLEYVDLISLLSEKEQAYLYLKMINYVFYDKEVINLTENQQKIWNNLKRPIDKSVSQSKNVSRRYTNEYTNKDTKQCTNEDTKRGTHNMSMSNVNCNMSMSNNSSIEKIKEIVEYLNKKTDKVFKYTTKSTQDKIKARLNEGFKLDDFIAVIDKKTKEWNGTEFEQYLRPETLFGTKFESYLNQKEKQSKGSEEEWIT